MGPIGMVRTQADVLLGQSFLTASVSLNRCRHPNRDFRPPLRV